MKKWIVLAVVVLAIYLLSYAVFRHTNTEVWEKDGEAYVIFPENKVYLYYIYRPVSYIDGSLTGMRFHIGAHR